MRASIDPASKGREGAHSHARRHINVLDNRLLTHKLQLRKSGGLVYTLGESYRYGDRVQLIEFNELTIECGGGRTQPLANSCSVELDYFNRWKFDTLCEIFRRFCAVHFKYKKHLLGGATYFRSCNSAHSYPKCFFSVGLLVLVHSYYLVQVRGQYIFYGRVTIIRLFPENVQFNDFSRWRMKI